MTPLLARAAPPLHLVVGEPEPAGQPQALEHLQPIDVPFDRPRTPALREAGDDGVLIAAEARHEGVQRRQVVSLNRAHPLLEPVAAQLPDHLGERSDVPGEGIQLRAAIQERLKVDSQLLD